MCEEHRAHVGQGTELPAAPANLGVPSASAYTQLATPSASAIAR